MGSYVQTEPKLRSPRLTTCNGLHTDERGRHGGVKGIKISTYRAAKNYAFYRSYKVLIQAGS